MMTNSPVLTDDWDPDSFDWQNMTSALRLVYDLSIFIEVESGIDFRNTSRNVIYVRYA